jgi:hypothetical protein
VSRLEEKSWPLCEIKFSVAAKIQVHARPALAPPTSISR